MHTTLLVPGIGVISIEANSQVMKQIRATGGSSSIEALETVTPGLSGEFGLNKSVPASMATTSMRRPAYLNPQAQI